MKRNLIIIKIGGSVIFDKKDHIREQVLTRLFETFSINSNPKIVIIGCGKLLHDITYKCNLTDIPEIKSGKVVSQNKRIDGFFQLYVEIAKNLKEVIKLFPTNARPLLLHPINLFIKSSLGNKNKHEIAWFNKRVFEKISYPITSGGIVFDKKIIFSAISSDTIASYLAIKYKAKKIIMISNVDGVLENLNKNKLIKTVRLRNLDKYQISGGMFDKLRRIKPAILAKIPVQIVNGNHPRRVFDLLSKGETKIYSQVKI